MRYIINHDNCQHNYLLWVVRLSFKKVELFYNQGVQGKIVWDRLRPRTIECKTKWMNEMLRVCVNVRVWERKRLSKSACVIEINCDCLYECAWAHVCVRERARERESERERERKRETWQFFAWLRPIFFLFRSDSLFSQFFIDSIQGWEKVTKRQFFSLICNMSSHIQTLPRVLLMEDALNLAVECLIVALGNYLFACLPQINLAYSM